MLYRIAFIIMLGFALLAVAQAQTPNTPSPATRKRTVTNNPDPQKGGTTPQDAAAQQTPNSARQADKKPRTKLAASQNVSEVFEGLLEGIRAADVKLVTGIYWNSPQLVLFNNNGTVTKGWEQMRRNRESSYPEMKDVVLEVRDVRVQMMGQDGALVTCLWTQSQTFRGVSETASGRMSLVFRRLGGAWKAIHLHTSPDAPDPSRVLPSENATTPTKTTP